MEIQERRINRVLQDMYAQNIRSVTGIIVTSREGLIENGVPVFDSHSGNIGALAAMAETTLSLSENMCAVELKVLGHNVVEVEKDDLREIIIKGRSWSKIIMGAGSEKVLIVLSSRPNPTEELLQEIRNAAEKIKNATPITVTVVEPGKESWRKPDQ